MALLSLRDKWAAFGWSAHEVDGHDVGILSRLLSNVPDGTGKPVAIIAHTIKGKGVSFMQDDSNWHYRVPKAEELVATPYRHGSKEKAEANPAGRPPGFSHLGSESATD